MASLHALDALSGGGQMGEFIRSYDWSQSKLGPIETWPQSLLTAASIVLSSGFPMILFWGSDLVVLYNDAYIPIFGARHPTSLGKTAFEAWGEVWDVIGPMFDEVMLKGKATWSDNELLLLTRNGYVEECYFTWSYSPIRDESGQVGGVLTPITETTDRVLGERRLRTLRELGNKITSVNSISQACSVTAEVLALNPADIPFSLIYLTDVSDKQTLLLKGWTGLSPNLPASPTKVLLVNNDKFGIWPFAEVLVKNELILVPALADKFNNLPGGIWPESPQLAAVLPLVTADQNEVVGVLIVGISPRRAFDEDYKGFLELVAGQLTKGLDTARAYEAERKRAETLAEIDRAKTHFFSNVSHEFRTPLTLMLGPIEDMLAAVGKEKLTSTQRQQMEILYRNALRLLKLVNTLLDFSRIEAGRMQAHYQVVDLAKLTFELASTFRSAIERAGMKLIVECQPLFDPTYIDIDMWEKIVLNLISNAFKYTLAGEIKVTLQQIDYNAILSVQDTGIGIPKKELPHLFERFHRVEGAKGRTYEGSGIGLSLVCELVKLHHGTISVDSVYQQGSIFTVAIPCGSSHLSEDSIIQHPHDSTAIKSQAFVDEALRWLPNPTEDNEANLLADMPEHFIAQDVNNIEESINNDSMQSPLPRIVLADDNADMREYVTRLLHERYEVIAVANGEAALTAIRQYKPNLVISDVMMPVLDGFELLKYLRADPAIQATPVILLSARAGEESRIEGLDAGADDYLVKPFSAKELMARVKTHLEMMRIRKAAANREKALLAEKQAITDHLNLALDAAQIGTWTWTLTQNQWFLDLQLHNLFCISQQATINTLLDFLNFIFIDDREKVHQAILQALETKKPFDIEFRIIKEDTSIRVIATRGQAFYNDKAEPERLAGVCWDITEHKHLEEWVRKHQAELAQVTKLSAMAEMASSLAHELNQPLMVIATYTQGCLEQLESGQFNYPDLLQAIREAAEQSERAGQIIHRMKDFMRKQQLTLEPVVLDKMIQDAVRLFNYDLVNYPLVLDYNFDALPLVWVDKIQLQQVILNLLRNSLEAVRDAQVTNPTIHIQTKFYESHQVLIQITDNGPGFPATIAPKLFDFYFTTKPYGTGMGLAICRSVIEAHGGVLTLTSSPSPAGGAQVNLVLPINRRYGEN